MKPIYRQVIAWLRRVFLEWKFLRGASNADLSPALHESTARYEEVEEVCLRRGQRSRRIVRKLVEEA
jgi:hypothetical protein